MQTFVPRLVHDILCQNTDKQNSHAVNLDDIVGLEQSGIIGTDMQIGVDDRKLCTLFQEQKVRDAVIRLMIADSNHIRRQHIHNFNSGNPAEFGIDKRVLLT